jgi:hypothetical protein
MHDTDADRETRLRELASKLFFTLNEGGLAVFGCVPHGVANPATAQKCTMIDATFGRLVLAAQPESSS